MRRRRRGAVAILAGIFALLTVANALVVIAVPPTEAILTYEPLPVGYYVIIEGVAEKEGLGRLVGFRYGPADKFKQYYAPPAPFLLVGVKPWELKRVYYENGVFDVDSVTVEGTWWAGLLVRDRDTGATYSVAFAGTIYVSIYNITKRPRGEQNELVYGVNSVVLDENWSSLLFVTQDRVIVRWKNDTASYSLAELVGAPSECVERFRDGGTPSLIWTYGVVDMPICTDNIKPLARVIINDRVFVTAFSVSTSQGQIKYVLLAPPSALAMERVGILRRVASADDVHVHALGRVSGSLYVSFSPYSVPVKQEEYIAQNITRVIEGTHSCTPPFHGTEVFSLSWPAGAWSGKGLGPGELRLYEVNGSYYYCVGPMSWYTIPYRYFMNLPKYRELQQDVTIFASGPILALTSSARVYYSNVIVIPWSEAGEYTLIVVNGPNVRRVLVKPPSIFTSKLFLLSAGLSVAALLAVVNAKRLTAKEYIHVVLDYPEVTSFSITPPALVRDAAKRHVTIYGVCPTLVELARYYKVLPEIPEIRDPREEVIVCPFKERVNTESEREWRALARLLRSAFWGIDRQRPASGLFYTVVGDMLMYNYFYLWRGEEKPPETFIRALEEATRLNALFPFSSKPLGLVIVAPPRVARALAEEVGEFVEAGLVDIRSYATRHDVKFEGDPDRAANIASQLKAVIIVSSRSMPKFIEWLAEETLSYALRYYKAHGRL